MSIREMLAPYSHVAPVLRGDPYKMISDAIKAKDQSIIFNNMRKDSFTSGYLNGDKVGYTRGYGEGESVGYTYGFKNGVFRAFPEEDIIFYTKSRPGEYISAGSMNDLKASITDYLEEDKLEKLFTVQKERDDAFVISGDETILDRRQIKKKIASGNLNPTIRGKKVRKDTTKNPRAEREYKIFAERAGVESINKPYIPPSEDIVNKAVARNQKAIVLSSKGGNKKSTSFKSGQVEEIIKPNNRRKSMPSSPMRKTKTK